jgi:hypothetical protein
MGARRHEGEGMSTFEMSVAYWVMEEPVRLVTDGVQGEATSSRKGRHEQWRGRVSSHLA